MSLKTTLWILVFILCDVFMQVLGEYCKDYGQSCPMGMTCCGNTCCGSENYHHGFRWSLWNMWYFWFIVIFILMSCFGGCGYWRRRQLMLHQQQTILQHQQAYNNYMHQAFTMSPPPPHTSVQLPPFGVAGPPPPAAQPAGNFPAPPPYSEVTKPSYYLPNKDGLPPYTEGAYDADNNSIMPGANQGQGASSAVPVNADGPVPGLPPYSAVIDASSANYTPAPTSQQAAYSSTDPAFTATPTQQPIQCAPSNPTTAESNLQREA